MAWLTYDEFKTHVMALAQLHQWRDLSEDGVLSLYRSFPEQAGTNRILIDDESFVDAIKEFNQPQQRRRVPSDLVSIYKAVRLEATKPERRVFSPSTQQALNGSNGSNGANGSTPDIPEQKVRFLRQMRAMRSRTLPNFRQQCPYGTPCARTPMGSPSCQCLAEWNARPLTQQDWDLARGVSSSQAVAAATGGRVPPPDPKEHESGEVMWI